MHINSHPINLHLPTMEKNEAIAKARQDLEELYGGIADESVDLTFQYLAKIDQHNETITSERKPEDGKDAAKNSEQRENPSTSLPGGEGRVQRPVNIRMEGLSKASSASKGRETWELEGIHHSNTCALCSSHIHFFRHRCLVCGRVYCNNCVDIGMGEMTEGRKCIECLGRRFSQRYIKKAGKSSCCLGYASEVRQQELIWAEKGPRKSCDGKNNSSLVSNSRDTVRQATPQRNHGGNSRNFVVTRSPGFTSSPNEIALHGK